MNCQDARTKIVVDNVVFEYTNPQTRQSVRAIQNLSIKVKANEFLCVLGPSGCGKSTLLYLIAGLLKPTSGRVLVDDKPVVGPGSDRGMVFQEYALLPWRTVRENVSLGLRIRGVPARERRSVAQRFMELVGLEGFEDKYPHELSGGMRQRAAVARTLANSPQVILMDEPFAAVDAQTRTVLQEQLAGIWAANRLTAVFVTHHIDEAIFLGDRVLIMTPRPGRVHSEVPIDIPREDRHWDILEASEAFQDLKAHIGSTIRDLGGGQGPDGDK